MIKIDFSKVKIYLSFLIDDKINHYRKMTDSKGNLRIRDWRYTIPRELMKYPYLYVCNKSDDQPDSSDLEIYRYFILPYDAHGHSENRTYPYPYRNKKGTSDRVNYVAPLENTDKYKELLITSRVGDGNVQIRLNRKIIKVFTDEELDVIDDELMAKEEEAHV